MKPINTSKLQSDMDEHGYNRQRLAGVLRCSESKVSYIFSRGTVSENDLNVLETIFDRPKGYYDTAVATEVVTAPAQDPEKLIKALKEFSTNTFSYQMSHDKELRLMNETLLTILAAIKDLNKAISKLEGVSNNNTSKVTTAVAKIRVDTNNLCDRCSEIAKELKS